MVKQQYDMYISCVQKDISINSIVDLSYILVIGQLSVNPAPRLAPGARRGSVADAPILAVAAAAARAIHGPRTDAVVC